MRLKEKVLACSFSLKCVRSVRNIGKGSAWFKLMTILCFPIGLIKYLLLSILSFQKPKKYKYDLSVVAIIKNERDYIEEWLNFYIISGVDHFYIYDNDSNDDTEKLLQKYIKQGLIDYVKMPGEKRQCDAYNEAIQTGRKECRYMIIVDLDEFLFCSDKNEKLKDQIERVFDSDKHIGGIIVNWLLFGSNGLERKPEGLVIENYVRRAKNSFEENKNYKSIIDPRKVIGFSCPHYPIYLIGKYAVNEKLERIEESKVKGSYSKLRINHYFTKSKEEYEIKKNRGKADLNEKRDWTDFVKHDRNEVLDEEILYFIPELKKKMQEDYNI